MSDYFPDDLILQILYKLPAKSLLKCLSVCKSWNSLIKTPKFISAHLNETLSSNSNHPLLLLRLFFSGKEEYSLHFDNQEFNEYNRLHLPLEPSYFFRVVGSCNGLVCLSEESFEDDYVYHIILWNPSIRKYFSLPEPNVASCVYGCFMDDPIAFGFDSISNDYKVLRMSRKDSQTSKENLSGNRCPCRRADPLVEIELYSLTHNSWKSVATKYYIEYGGNPAAVNGAFLWIAHEKTTTGCTNFLSVFYLKDETFREISLPECLMNGNPADLSIKRFGPSSIAVVKKHWSTPSQYSTIWVMKEDCIGDDEIVGSWVKLLTVEMEGSNVLGFRKNGEVLLELSDERIVSMEPETRQTTDLRIQGGGYSFVVKYVESLVLLDQGNNYGDVIDIEDKSETDIEDLSETDIAELLLQLSYSLQAKMGRKGD